MNRASSLLALSLVATTAVSAAPTLTAQSAQAATPAVRITTWQADYGGTKVKDEPATNATLNGEYLAIANTTKKPVALGGYRVEDRGAIHRYTFPKGFVLAAGKSVVLHSGQGKTTAAHAYWGQSVRGAKPVSRNGYIWNNTGDTATLRSSTGAVVHTCTYKKVASGRKVC
ncbi:lamin tail domain-containing protein [Arsenicicoccus piscis]|uniref:LTD domain-containing protein n=1 Tax=Arsenicicoccus piscis TaxID=673954 RepID=A0ABQ6HMY9_9MICO|nr:lamin tail domain-containing protein [Arsenicicoccus piscis]MCH8628709.1 lamin tail domain-containing protein [Arsenicicoccus piscis]GMA19352.1 hypothetical protein GCM10025862_13730 [Arsenicicoccus piscis]